MRLFDTHCHFENADVAEISAIVERARAAGVERMMAVGGSALLNESAVAAAKSQHDLGVICALGYDRDQVSVERPVLPMPSEDAGYRIAAYGEIGLDYYYDFDIWQYGTGQVDGIEGEVDVNIAIIK